MPSFSESTLHQAWALAQGRCECQREHEGGRCDAPVLLAGHGYFGNGGWFARAWTPLEYRGPDTPEKVEVLCRRCYEGTLQQTAA